MYDWNLVIFGLFVRREVSSWFVIWEDSGLRGRVVEGFSLVFLGVMSDERRV